MHCYGETRSVHLPPDLRIIHPLTCRKVEYLVCCFDDKNKRVRLSLRQSDILEALASDEKLKQQGGGVAGIDPGKETYATNSNCALLTVLYYYLDTRPGFQHFIRNLAGLCWKPRLASHGVAISKISCKSRMT